MPRTACADLPALPLQILLIDRPTWRNAPVAVVEEDRPQARVLFVNEKAFRLGVLPGQRHAAALSLARDLHAGVVEETRIAACVEHLCDRLHRFSPRIEPSWEPPGTFWLDGSGLARHFPSADAWGRDIHAALVATGFVGRVAVGWTRFGAFAVTRAEKAPDVVAFADERAERRRAGSIHLDRLGVEPSLRDALRKLGVVTVDQLLELPPSGIRERFGDEAHHLHGLASGDAWKPFEPHFTEPPLQATADLEHPLGNARAIIHVVQDLWTTPLARLRCRGEAVRSLHLRFTFDDGGTAEESLQPAEPTLEEKLLGELLRLRLSERRFPSGVAQIALTVTGARLRPEQLALFATRKRRDHAALNRALARVRAALGNRTVVQAQLREGHLPEARFTWVPIQKLAPRKRRSPAPDRERVLVRRLVSNPLPLGRRLHQSRDAVWSDRSLTHEAVVNLEGPFVISGGWWRRALHREYHFAETRDARLLWLFYDRGRRRWFLQGEVL